jgi:hypothetical protein
MVVASSRKITRRPAGLPRSPFRAHDDFLLIACTKIYSSIEKLVLWARSEINGYAVKICRGKMEYWNVGILGLAEGDPFLFRWH